MVEEKVMSSTEDWLSEIISVVGETYIDIKTGEREGDYTHNEASIEYRETDNDAKSQIRQHMLSEALVLIGEDDNEVRGTTQSPDNPNYWTKRTKHRNELKAELRQAFTEKYGERG